MLITTSSTTRPVPTTVCKGRRRSSSRQIKISKSRRQKTKRSASRHTVKSKSDPIRKRLQICLQAEKNVQQHEQQMQALETAVNAADDEVFGEFCQRLSIDSVREYETVQLRAAEEESEARARFDAQIARLNHQYVDYFSIRLTLLFKRHLPLFKTGSSLRNLNSQGLVIGSPNCELPSKGRPPTSRTLSRPSWPLYAKRLKKQRKASGNSEKSWTR